MSNCLNSFRQSRYSELLQETFIACISIVCWPTCFHITIKIPHFSLNLTIFAFKSWISPYFTIEKLAGLPCSKHIIHPQDSKGTWQVLTTCFTKNERLINSQDGNSRFTCEYLLLKIEILYNTTDVCIRIMFPFGLKWIILL